MDPLLCCLAAFWLQFRLRPHAGSLFPAQVSMTTAVVTAAIVVVALRLFFAVSAALTCTLAVSRFGSDQEARPPLGHCIRPIPR